MDVSRAIKAPFQESEWFTKVGIGVGVSLVPILSWAGDGYKLEYLRSVADGDERLPDWSDLGTLFKRGALWFVAALVYYLPAAILFGIGGVIAAAAYIAALGGVVAEGDAGSLALASTAMGAAAAGGLFFILGGIYVVAVSVFAQAAFAHYAMNDTLASCFALGEIWKRLTSRSDYFAAWGFSLLIAIAGSIALSVVTGILGNIPVLGNMLVSVLNVAMLFVVTLVSSHLLGQYAAKAYGRPGLSPVAPVGYVAPPTAAAPPAPAPPAPPAAPAPPAPPMPEAPDAPAAPAPAEGEAPK